MDWGGKITYLAETRVKDKAVCFGIKDADRLQHVCIVGKSGTGRSDFLTNIILQDVARGVGVVILDTKGTVVPTLLERLPKDTHERLIYLDPSDGEHPYSWNPIDDFRSLPPERAVSALSETLASMYKAPEGPLIDFAASYILSRADTTILFLYDLISDPKARDRLIPPKTPARAELDALIAGSEEAVRLITDNGRYLAKDSLMRNVLGQPTSKFTLEILQKGGILVVDFSRIRMFPTRITPLVRLFVDAARTRTKEGKPLALYLHDCLRYLSEHDLESVLFDKLIALIVSDTSHGEEEKMLREKALQRSGSIVAFPPHEMDADLVHRAFYPYVPPEEFEKLGPGELVMALAIDSIRSRPFFAKSLSLPERTGMSHQDLQVVSRSKYTTSRLKVDEMFKPKKVSEGEKGKAEDPGSFSDAFRSIFTKRANGTSDTGTPKSTSPPISGADGSRATPSKPLETKDAKASPQQKNDTKTVSQPSEIPEDTLKKMMQVRKVRSKNKREK